MDTGSWSVAVDFVNNCCGSSNINITPIPVLNALSELQNYDPSAAY